jgi:hypothetical protein
MQATKRALTAHAGMQRAELLAFLALIAAKLEPATTYTTWCEGESYSRHTRAAYGAGLPLPLSYWLPWSQRRAALRRFAASSREQVCCHRWRPMNAPPFVTCKVTHGIRQHARGG